MNSCFTLAVVSVFVPHDRAVVLNAGYSVTITAADWSRLVDFASTRDYLIPEAEGSR